MHGNAGESQNISLRRPRRRDFRVLYSKYRQRRMRRQSTARFTSFANMAAKDLRVSQISIRGESARMKRVNGGKLCLRIVPLANAISQERERERKSHRNMIGT